MTAPTKKPRYSVVVPVYNTGDSLRDLVARLQSVFTNTIKASFEIILVDDGSVEERTKALLNDLARQDGVMVVRLTRNFGKPGAVLCGLGASRGDWVITIDDDLQQSPEDIPLLIAHEQHDTVTATHAHKQHTVSQRMTSWIKARFDKAMLGYQVKLSPLKLIRRHVVDGMLAIKTNRPFIPALIRQVTNDVVGVPSEHHKSAQGHSRYSLTRRWGQFSDLLVGNSNFLMQVFTRLGFVVAALSFALAMVVIVRKLLDIPTQAGWSSLMVAILLIGGLNLAAIGITGQYFIRLLDITSKKPAFVIRERLGAPDSDQTHSGD
ncbi:MAG: glycosyl transferase [Robiginitomaculum sp.]|nr:MAG: glycosyl transferase [Robiginitomaculum sp.]